MALTIIDTDILIDAGRGIDDAVELISRLSARDTLAISIVTQMELTVGCRNKLELQTLKKFLRRFQVLASRYGYQSELWAYWSSTI